MGVVIVTSFGNIGYEVYGKHFLDTLSTNAATNIEVLVYHEGLCKEGSWYRQDILELSECSQFLSRHRNNLFTQGKRRYGSTAWKAGALKEGYNFRFDAYKFARKVFAIADAANRCAEGSKLFWIDADMVFKSAMSPETFHDLLKDDEGVCYLNRKPYHSECGFVGYNLQHKEVRRLISQFKDVYALDTFFQLKEWHDSFVFDEMLYRFKGKILERHIPHTSCSDPVGHSELATYMTHLKGDRKFKGAEDEVC